jgi:S1-C subfamily serine protease
MSRLQDYRVGDQVKLHVWRAGTELDVKVTLQPGG